MQCTDCGAELAKGVFYCTGCGKPVGFPSEISTMTEEAGLDGVPPPSRPSEAPPRTTESKPSASSRTGRALCSLCMGSFPESLLSRVDGNAYCPDCSPLTGRRAEPEPTPARMGTTTTRRTPPPRPYAYRGERPAGGGMKLVAGLLVLVLLAAGGYAAFRLLGRSRIDGLMSGLDTDARPGRLLYQKYEAGERIRYAAKMKIEGSVEASGVPLSSGGGNLDIDARILGGVAIDVVSVDERGNAELRISLDSFDAAGSVKVNGQEMPLGGAGGIPGLSVPGGQSFVLKVDPFGSPIGGEMGAGGSPLPGLESILGGQFGKMPDKEMKIGDEWTAEQKVDVPNSQGMGMGLGSIELRAKYRVEGYKRILGRECMVISLEGGMDHGGGGMGGMLDLDMGADLEGVVFFDPEAGRMVKAAMDLALTMSVEGGGNSMDGDIRIEIDIDLQ